MKQSVYILNNDFFSKDSVVDYDEVSGRIEELTKSERVLLVCDSFCSPTFESLIDNDCDDMLEEFLLDYYGQLETCSEISLDWFQMNSYTSRYFDVLNELMLFVDINKFSISSIGVLPFLFGKTQFFLYFHINPYLGIENKFYLLKKSDYIEILKGLDILSPG